MPAECRKCGRKFQIKPFHPIPREEMVEHLLVCGGPIHWVGEVKFFAGMPGAEKRWN